MPLSFLLKRSKNNGSFFPLDFYRFKHTTQKVQSPKRNINTSKPLWIVGISPFDEELFEDEGHVVHLGQPSFTARWSMNEDQGLQAPDPLYYDEDLNMAIYDVIPLDGSDMPTEEWLVEAVCAVGYSRGLITMAPLEEMH